MSSLHRVLICFIGLTMVLVSGGNTKGDEAARERFLKEYPEANQQLENFYTNLQMEFVLKVPLTKVFDEQPRVRAVDWRIREFRYFANGSSHRLDVFSEDNDSTVSYVATPDLSFKVSRKSGAGQHRLERLSTDSAEDYERQLRAIHHISRIVTNIPYGFGPDNNIRDLLWADHRTIEKVEQMEQPDGTVVVQVDWREHSPEDELDNYLQYGKFTFLPDSDWSIQKLQFFTPIENPETGKTIDAPETIVVSYEGEHEGVPLLKSSEQWMGKAEFDIPRTTAEVQKITPEPAPEDAFTLAAFGIRTDPAPQPVPVTYYLIGLSLACVVLVFVFRYLQKRSEHSAASA